MSRSEVVRVGIVGLGRCGTFHLERLSLRADFGVAAVFDERREAAQIAAPFGCRICRSSNELLDDPEIELVVVATPPDSHAPLALQSLEAGKHVVVEKPLCLTVKDADALLETAARSQRLLTVVHNRRWDVDFQSARHVVNSNALGELRSLKLIAWEYGTWPDEPSSAAGWQDDPARGGGALFGFGTHYFDQLLQLVPQPPRSVYCVIPGRSGDSDRRTFAAAETAFLAVVTFAGGIVAQVEVDMASPVALKTGWALTGSCGGYSRSRQFTVTADGELYDVPAKATVESWDRAFYDAVVRSVREGAPAPVFAADARRVLTLIHAARQSAINGEVVRL